MFELSQATPPTGILEENEKLLLEKTRTAPVAALKELKQKWDTLMGLKKAGDSKRLWGDISAAHNKFSTFYQGVVTVPESLAELKAGKLRYLLSTYVADYYDQKRVHLAYVKPGAPAYDPAVSPPVQKPAVVPRPKMSVGVVVAAGSVVALLVLWMAVRRR